MRRRISIRGRVRPSVRPSVRLSRVIFRRVLGASCAVYPALLSRTKNWSEQSESQTVVNHSMSLLNLVFYLDLSRRLRSSEYGAVIWGDAFTRWWWKMPSTSCGRNTSILSSSSFKPDGAGTTSENTSTITTNSNGIWRQEDIKFGADWIHFSSINFYFYQAYHNNIIFIIALNCYWSI